MIGSLLVLPEQLFSSLAIQAEMIHATLASKQASFSFPFADIIMSQGGVLKVIGLCAMLTLSPVITVVWSQIPFIGSPTWYGCAIAAYAITWWCCFPCIIRSIFDAIGQRNTWWVLWQATFIVWFIIAALSRQGAGFDGFRYRDAMLPVSMLLAVKGIEVTMASPQSARFGRALVLAYGFMIFLIVVLRGADILRMK